MAFTRCCATASALPPSLTKPLFILAATGLSLSAQRDLQAAAVLLRETSGFLFLPMFVESERAAAAGLVFLQEQLGAKMYPVAWPVDLSPTSAAPPDAPGDLPALRVALLSNLDDAIAKLPPNAVLVLDASSSVRHALALEAMAYINHRREPLRAAGLRFILCWPAALRQELLAHAPDMWSMRTASPWIAEADLLLPSAEIAMSEQAVNLVTSQHVLPPASARKLEQWHRHHDLQAADLSPRDAVALAKELNTYGQSSDAAELAEAACHAVNHANPTALDDLATKAYALNLLAIARHQLGNDVGALQVAHAAVAQAQLLAQSNPVAFEPLLSASLNNLANLLSSTGNRIDSLQAALKVVEICKRLSQVKPDTYEPDLATSINNLAIRLRETGDILGALFAAREAVAIRRRLAQVNPAVFEPYLAASISNLSNNLRDNGDQIGALKAAQEAEAIYTRLVKENPATFEPALATSKNNLALSLNNVNDRTAALQAIREAVAIRRRLSKINPAVFEPDLASSLNNLGNSLSEVGLWIDALQTAYEAVTIYRRLAQANPAAFESDLAMSLKNLAKRLSETGDLPGARSVAEEALRLYEQANQQHVGLFEAEIAQTRQLLDQLEAAPSSHPTAI